MRLYTGQYDFTQVIMIRRPWRMPRDLNCSYRLQLPKNNSDRRSVHISGHNCSPVHIPALRNYHTCCTHTRSVFTRHIQVSLI